MLGISSLELLQLLVRTDCKSRALKNGADTRIYNSNWDFWMLGRLSLRLICSQRRFASIQSGRVCSNFSKCIATCVPTCPFQVFANGMNLFYERAGSSKNAVLCLTGSRNDSRTLRCPTQIGRSDVKSFHRRLRPSWLRPVPSSSSHWRL